MKTLIIAALLAASLPVFAGDAKWPRFRGPEGAGVADGAKPPVEFGPEKNVLWQVATPSGPSSPCIWSDRIFLTAFDGGKLWTLCLDRATGKELWRHALPCAETNNDFGSGTSPILADGLVVLVRDLKADSAVFALDATTGKPVWKTARPGFFTGYSTPAIWEHDGRKELVVSGGLAMKAYDLRTGAERWTMRDLAAVNCTSPVVGAGLLYFAGWSPAGKDAPMPAFTDLLKFDTDADGKLSRAEAQQTFLKDFFSAQDTDKDGFLTTAEWDAQIGYLKRGKNRLVAVKPGGTGDITATHIAWEKTKGLPYVPSPLLYRGALFLIKDGGLASSFDAATGTPHYEQQRLEIPGPCYASPVAANGHIYLVNLDGKAATLAAGPKPEVLWRADFHERIAATPAIVDDTIYVRTETKLFAFKERK